MPCRMGFEREEALTEEALKLATYLCDSIDQMGKSLSENNIKVTPDLSCWAERYDSVGRDIFLEPFNALVEPFHKYGMFPADYNESEIYKTCDSLTAALCNSLGLLETLGRIETLSPTIKEWWRKHQIEDQIREAAEPVLPAPC